jgi:hypothetical protein
MLGGSVRECVCDADFYLMVVRPGGSVETHAPELSVLSPVPAPHRVSEYRCEVSGRWYEWY